MTPNTRQQIVGLLAELADLAPEVRIGQMCSFLGVMGEDETGRTLWDIDDEQLLPILRKHREQLLARTKLPNADAGSPDSKRLRSKGAVGR